MVLLCDIQLDNRALIYQPGQLISGRIVLTIEERVLIKAFGLKISGYAATRWEIVSKSKSEKKMRNIQETDAAKESMKKVEIYTNREDYISTINYYIGSEDSLPKIFENGVYRYTFTARLPDNCPTTFEDDIGHIRYEMVGFIDYPDCKTVVCTRSIKVERPYDLQQEGALIQHYATEVIEKRSVLIFWQRPLVLHVNIPQTGYIPGEPISVHVKVLNYEHMKLGNIVYNLNRIGTYHATCKKKSKVKVDRKHIAQVEYRLFDQKANIIEHLQVLPVPVTTPSTEVKHCKCIQISYEVEVLINSVNKKRHLSAQLPIKVGTISLRSSLTKMPQAITASAPVLPVQSESCLGQLSQPSAPIPESPDIAGSMSSLATSFREVDFMKPANLSRKQRGSVDQLEFKPRYLYYNIDK